ncbi:MAG: carbamoyltransferase [Candidatus Coatesbacteria bacterium]
MKILGLSAFYHDSAAALVVDGELVAAAQEERFSRLKHDAGFPAEAVRWCIEAGGVGPEGPDAVAFYDKPVTKFVRLLETHFAVAPRGLRSFVAAMPLWTREKLWIPLRIESCLESLGVAMPRDLFFLEHHESHAASAFYPSPFPAAAILTVDGVGEWATASVGRGRGHAIELMSELRFPHSLGLLYSAFTAYCGFEVNDGEYKLMGLAPYGEPRYAREIRDRLVDIKEDGSIRLNMALLGYLGGLSMTNGRFEEVFGGPPRRADEPVTQRHKDLARSVQEVTEEIVLRMGAHAHATSGEKRLCLAGGVALNCVANGRLLREGPFDEVWIQPAAGDAGGAIGAALAVWHGIQGRVRDADGVHDRMRGALLGPAFGDEACREVLDREGCTARRLDDAEWATAVARLIADGKIVGLCQGRMEFGPRAMGNRSILADPRDPGMKDRINLRVKGRESFRPFAPAVLEERAAEWFELEAPSPYMLLTARVRAGRNLPAVTHVDGSARVQTVDAVVNPRFHAVIAAFDALTGCPVVLNTSFNLSGEPIVCTPADALRTFRRAGLDALVLGNYLVTRA